MEFLLEELTCGATSHSLTNVFFKHQFQPI